MTYKALATDIRVYLGVALVAILGAFLARGGQGAAGMALGLTGTGFSVTALWLLIKQLGKVPADSRRSKTTSILIVIAFFAKLPLYMVVGILAYRIGGGAPTCFLLGIALVYFALVGWALAQS